MTDEKLQDLKSYFKECEEYHLHARNELAFDFGAGELDPFVTWHDGCVSAFREVLRILDTVEQ